MELFHLTEIIKVTHRSHTKSGGQVMSWFGIPFCGYSCESGEAQHSWVRWRGEEGEADDTGFFKHIGAGV